MTATLTSGALAPAPAASIVDWNPEDEHFWATTGRRVARRNLIFSISSPSTWASRSG